MIVQGSGKIHVPDGVQGGTGFQFDMTWLAHDRDLLDAVVFSGTRRSISTGITLALTGDISAIKSDVVRWNPSIVDLQDADIHEVQITATFPDGFVRTSPSTWIVWENNIVGGVVPLPPPGTERFVVIGLAGEMIFLSRNDFLALIDADPAGSAATVQANLDTHIGLTGTAVHGLGSASVEDASAFDAAGSAATVQGNLDTHTGDTSNPHAVTALQTGADPVGSAAAAQAAAIAASDPAGSAAAAQAAAIAASDPAGSAAAAQAAVQGNLDTHTGDGTIHFTQAAISITPAQAGAMPMATEADYLLASGTRTGATTQPQTLSFGTLIPDDISADLTIPAGYHQIRATGTTLPGVTVTILGRLISL